MKGGFWGFGGGGGGGGLVCINRWVGPVAAHISDVPASNCRTPFDRPQLRPAIRGNGICNAHVNRDIFLAPHLHNGRWASKNPSEARRLPEGSSMSLDDHRGGRAGGWAALVPLTHCLPPGNAGSCQRKIQIVDRRSALSDPIPRAPLAPCVWGPKRHSPDGSGHQQLLIELSHGSTLSDPIMRNALVQCKNMQFETQSVHVHVVNQIELSIEFTVKRLVGGRSTRKLRTSLDREPSGESPMIQKPLYPRCTGRVEQHPTQGDPAKGLSTTSSANTVERAAMCFWKPSRSVMASTSLMRATSLRACAMGMSPLAMWSSNLASCQNEHDTSIVGLVMSSTTQWMHDSSGPHPANPWFPSHSAVSTSTIGDIYPSRP